MLERCIGESLKAIRLCGDAVRTCDHRQEERASRERNMTMALHVRFLRSRSVDLDL